MIWIDFGVICMGQEEKSVPPEMNNFIFEAYQRSVDSAPFYIEPYKFHTADTLTGYWYKIWLPELICYEESFFDISPKGAPYVGVNPKYTIHVKSILEFYINESPVHKIAVLLRVQDFSNDVVHSSCSLDDFIQALKDGNIKWNELYYVYL